MTNEYFKLEVNFFDHAKVVDLGDTALRLHLTAIAYANRLMTDGFIATNIARRLVDPDPHGQGWDWRDHVKELLDAKLWHEVEGGFQIHDFLDHNTSREERLRKRQAEKDRKAAYRDGKRASQPRPPDVPTGQADVSQRDSASRPDGTPAGQDASTETETETETETGDAFGARPPAAPDPPTLVVVPDPPVTAQTLTAEFVDKHHARGSPVARSDKGQAAKQYAQLLRDGFIPEQIRAGTDDWLDRDQHIATLTSFVTARARGGRARASPNGKVQRQLNDLEQTFNDMTRMTPPGAAHAHDLGRMESDHPQAQRQLPRPAHQRGHSP